MLRSCLGRDEKGGSFFIRGFTFDGRKAFHTFSCDEIVSLLFSLMEKVIKRSRHNFSLFTYNRAGYLWYEHLYCKVLQLAMLERIKNTFLFLCNSNMGS